MTRVALVTGVTGQDGGYLAEQLLGEGVAVHGLVREGDGLVEELLGRSPAVQLHTGDLTDERSLARVFDVVGPDEVYNLAGISSVAFSWEHPVVTADVTGLGAARLLEAAWRHSRDRGSPVRFVQASSGEIFGDPVEDPQSESTPVRPTSPYGAAKAFAHSLVGVYRSRGLHACSAILYNHESPRRPATFVTRKITRSVARIARGLQDELVLGNLDARRDWGWAPDYVDAMVRAARHEEAGDYVVATGRAHSVGDFVAAAFARVGVHEWRRYVRVDDAFVRPADAGVLRGDPGKAARILGWTPTVGFEEVVGRMVDHDLSLLQAD